MRSFKPKHDRDDGAGGNAERDLHGETRSNDTHASTTDADARPDKPASTGRQRGSRAGRVSSARHGWRTAAASWSKGV
jgi:hypothetical protein